MQKGVTVWFTGLSGAGKTTISGLVEAELRQSGKKVEALDGDVVRRNLTADLGFSKEDRFTNIQRVAYVATLLTRNDIIVLASFISPYQEMRDYCRKEIGSFIEVFVKCPLEECISRDVKGLYKKALKGEISHFTGITDHFEEPMNPDVVVETGVETPQESAAIIMAYLARNHYV
ncbi:MULTISPECIES: adenylyl-sulfate kinase [unclassified Paenibacillus]|uniref:adenylyl-sulfate kinase n=1 Tax=unclassified Paenibacillus TaxID=185978 RepID=UPI002780650C|nr:MULTISPECIES: adenylyl-sulfate kinase [unclassified Paenibacillus]MDQ0897078.1 adenylylsulfate kinase [Paenibacillus sp. V4I7]MDQ0916772.1 adenylylsulfate kinase [Paenibacillus sp. V4I5]